MNHSIVPRRWRLLSLAALATAATALGAQTSSGSIRGYVRAENGAAVLGATVTARNAETNAQRSSLSNDQGFYAIPGLVPGEYELTLKRIGLEPQTRRQRVQIGEVLSIDFTTKAVAAQLAPVAILAPGARETRTSEVATNVSREQINSLPSVDRNFLDLAGLAPGVRVTGSGREGTTKSFLAGALPAQNVNVFIDGASYKSDVLPSGVTGQDASRGNPFPQIAVQEFRVLTNNYKAEYQKASSAIITATTKSGTNEWRGSALFFGQNKSLQTLDYYQNRDKNANPTTYQKPDYSRSQMALSLGGPLAKDKLFFFGAFEGNYQDRANRVSFNPLAANFPAVFGGKEGTFTSPFRSNLGIAKVNYIQNENISWEASANIRNETDIRSFGGGTSFESAENVKVDVGTYLIKQTWAKGSGVNEAQLVYQDSKWNPTPSLNVVGMNYFGIGRVGGSSSYQKFDQKRLSFRDDYTYTGFNWHGAHVMKFGGNVDFDQYNIEKFINGNPEFRFRSDENYLFPFEAGYGSGNPNMNTSNNQIGIYAQDDWGVTSRLLLSLGVRWDYESDMFNNSYTTPALERTELGSQFPASYFTDGSQRPGFKGAVQPRVGFNYALDDAGRTTVFGAFGIYYDRSPVNNSLDEKYRLQYQQINIHFSADGLPRYGQPTTKWDPKYLTKSGLDALVATGQAGKPEAFLVDNGTKPPHSTMFSLGVRHNTGNVVLSATYTGVRSVNGFTYIFGNRNPDGGCCRSVAADFGNVLLSSNDPKTWYDAVILQVDKPYRRDPSRRFNWGGGITWTIAQAQQQGGDLFSLDYPTVAQYPKVGTDQNQRHAIVGNWIMDIPFLAGAQWSGQLHVGSGDKFYVTDCTAGYAPGQCKQERGSGTPDSKYLGSFIGGSWGFRNVDMRFRKDLPPIGGTRIGLIAEAYNIFNFSNFGCYDGFMPKLPDHNANFGVPGCVVTDARRFQVGAQLDWH